MAKTPHDIVASGTLDLYTSSLDKRQAQLDYERAMATEQYKARTVPGAVFQQLKELKEKEAARAAKIKEQGQQEGPSPSSMVPPLTDTSGQMQGRSAAGALKAGSDILDTILGGRGVKTGQVGGAPGGGLPNSTGGINPGATAPLMAAGISGPILQAAAQVPAAAGYPSAGPPVATPAGTTHGPTGPPGTTQPVTRDLSAVERYLVAPAKIIGGGLTRNAGLGVSGLQDLAGGKEIVDYQRIPTVAEQAKPLAEPMAAYVAASYNSDPISAARARQLKDMRLDQIEKEFGRDVRESVEIQAMDKYMVDEEARLQAAEDPVIKKARFVAETQQMLGEKVLRGEKLTGAEQAWLDMGKKAAATTIVNNIIDPNMGQLSKATVNKIQGQTVSDYPIMQILDEVEKNFYEPGFTYVGKGEYETLKSLDKAGTIPAAWKETLKKFHNNEQAVSTLTAERVTEEGGKTFTPTETEAIKKTIVEMGNSPTQAKESIPFVREQFGLSIFRNTTLLGKVQDPRFAQSLGSTRTAAQNQARQLMLEYQTNQGLSEDAAFEQVQGEYRNRYGLDLVRLMKR